MNRVEEIVYFFDILTNFFPGFYNRSPSFQNTSRTTIRRRLILRKYFIPV